MKALVYHENEDEQMIVEMRGPNWRWHAGEVIWDERLHGPLPLDLSELGGYSRAEAPHPNNPLVTVYSLEVDEVKRDAQVSKKAQEAIDAQGKAQEKLQRKALIDGINSANTIQDLKEVVKALIVESRL